MKTKPSIYELIFQRVWTTIVYSASIESFKIGYNNWYAPLLEGLGIVASIACTCELIHYYYMYYVKTYKS